MIAYWFRWDLGGAGKEPQRVSALEIRRITLEAGFVRRRHFPSAG